MESSDFPLIMARSKAQGRKGKDPNSKKSIRKRLANEAKETKLKQIAEGILGDEEDGIVEGVNEETNKKFVLFYGGTPYLSNFYAAKFELDGVQFVNNEQFFHYKKAELFGDKEVMEKILATEIPREHKKLGREASGFDVAVWNEKCEDIMKQGLVAKFSQNDDLKKLLIATLGSTLVEASPRDKKWGIGMSKNNPLAVDKTKWKGQNLLGEILMKVRDEILQSTEKSVEKKMETEPLKNTESESD